MSTVRSRLCVFTGDYRFSYNLFQVTWITVLYIIYLGITTSDATKYNQGKETKANLRFLHYVTMAFKFARIKKKNIRLN